MAVPKSLEILSRLSSMFKIENELKTRIQKALAALNFEVTLNDITIETPKDESLGDYSTNAALKYAKQLKNSPVKIAQQIVDTLSGDSFFTKIEVAGPGFINFFLNPKTYYPYLSEIANLGDRYGDLEKKNIKLNLEYVSANPTGNLHLGHARGAALGDSLARLLRKSGYDVTREFYVNDAGKQVENLAESLYSRYLELFGIKYPIPEDGYYGQDVIQIAKDLKKIIGDKYTNIELKNEALEFFLKEGKARELAKIKTDLHDFRVDFDIYTFESDIRARYDLNELIQKLGDNTYISEGARFLKTSAYLDDKDRPIVKSDGSFTYLLPDIAYHLDKLSRGYDQLIDVLGADHHGYIPRITSSIMMFGYPKDTLKVEIIQMVRIMKDGEEMKMSKRTGNALSMRDLCEMAGVDAVRYFFINRAASTHFDFDLDLATNKTSANPVYYAQYAHARLARVLETASEKGLTIDFSGTHLVESQEINLLKLLVSYEKVIEDAASERAPYKIANFIQKLANSIHYFYTKSRILDEELPEVTASRLALVKASQIVLKNSLELIGVSAPLKM